MAQQNQEVERKNSEVEQARQELEEKAKQLALTSKYKSEFLANMSHELRTPLNSLLILSDQLTKNSEGNLTSKQTEFAKIIHSSGNDLLMLINDILDLSKIESGTVIVDASELRLDELRGYVERTFKHVAEQKNVEFQIRFEPGMPKSMFTDSKRLQQIIKNLLSNAFKFTHHGQVALSVHSAESGWSTHNDELNKALEVLAFSVSDTGIGISPDKQQIVFEAFQQADGSTSRKYGGTGLGLAISRELSRLLGGEIRLNSSPGRGSTFTLYLPLNYTPPRSSRKALSTNDTPVPGTTNRLTRPQDKQGQSDKIHTNGTNGNSGPFAVLQPILQESDLHYAVNEAGDDRDDIRTGDRVLLIVENDLSFARFLLETAREKGFKGLVTSLGATALSLTREYKPHAITLDIYLPDIAGWRVLERLKNDISTRHTPVCVISTDESRSQALASGALAFIAKPIQSKDLLDKLLTFLGDYIGRATKQLLVIEPDESRRNHILECIGGEDVEVAAAADNDGARQILDKRRIDCLVLGTQTSGASANFEPADMAGEGSFSKLPIIVYGNEENVDDGASWSAWEKSAPSAGCIRPIACST